MGKERGYLLYDEVNDILPPEVHSSEEIDDLLSTFERYGIDVYEDLASAKAALAAADSERSADIAAKRNSASRRRRTRSDCRARSKRPTIPVRMYLREMGTVPLLTREGEVAIAKRIERGQLARSQDHYALADHPERTAAVGEDLRNGTRSIKEIVQFDDEELTEEKIEAKTHETLKQIDKIAKLYLVASSRRRSSRNIPRSNKRPYLRARYRAWPHPRRDVEARPRARFQSASRRSA